MPGRPPTRQRLVETAARLFRARGYHGVGLIELLDAAAAPKGSLYHAFPAGKADLALAAADHAAAGIQAGIAAAFGPARDWAAGLEAYCAGLAAAFEAGDTTCPVTPILFDGPENAAFRARLAVIYGRWTRALAYHAIRLGDDEDHAESRARILLVAVQGALAVARAQGDSAPLRALPALLSGCRQA